MSRGVPVSTAGIESETNLYTSYIDSFLYINLTVTLSINHLFVLSIKC